jgi:hypothetical protein
MKAVAVIGILLAILMVKDAFADAPSNTAGKCSSSTPDKQGDFTISCSGVSPDQGQEMVKILNQILEKYSERMASAASGAKKASGPGGSTGDGPPAVAFEKLRAIETDGNWPLLRDESEEQMRARPDWFTPYVFCAEAYLRLGDREKARALLEKAKDGIAGNHEYDELQTVITGLLVDTYQH